MPDVSSVSFLIIIYVFIKLLVPNGLPYMSLLRKNIKNINSLVSRGLNTLMLTTYIRHIWVCSILITLSGDIENNPRPHLSFCDKFSICHWNLNSISAHNFIKNLYYAYIVSTPNLCLSQTYLDSSISSNNKRLTIPSYDLYRADHPSIVKRGGWGWGLYLFVSAIKLSTVESNRHSIPTRVHQLRNENRGKIM